MSLAPIPDLKGFTMLRHFIDTQDFTTNELLDIITLTRRI
jgi:ornithine carbamoyltransferase